MFPVTLKDTNTGQPVSATIRTGRLSEMPSMHDGWSFNFIKHFKPPRIQAHVLTLEASDALQGCVLFELLDGQLPYMGFLEVAPHNYGRNKRYEGVAACLLAYACQLSFELGKGSHQGYLTFTVSKADVQEHDVLVALYLQKYGAQLYRTQPNYSSLLFSPLAGKQLIDTYL